MGFWQSEATCGLLVVSSDTTPGCCDCYGLPYTHVERSKIIESCDIPKWWHSQLCQHFLSQNGNYPPCWGHPPPWRHQNISTVVAKHRSLLQRSMDPWMVTEKIIGHRRLHGWDSLLVLQSFYELTVANPNSHHSSLLSLSLLVVLDGCIIVLFGATSQSKWWLYGQEQDDHSKQC